MIANKCVTSMILLLKEFHRISIDIDIVTLTPHAEYEPILADIGRKAPFLGYEEDDRGERGLPHRTHFKFFYEEAKISASRAVLLTALLKTQPKERALKSFRWNPNHISELTSLELKPPIENLNRIKTLIPEAFYNLYTAQELLKQ